VPNATIYFFEYSSKLVRDGMSSGTPFCFELKNEHGRCEVMGQQDEDGTWSVCFRFDEDPWRGKRKLSKRAFVKEFDQLYRGMEKLFRPPPV
jgi:hypothetical protein